MLDKYKESPGALPYVLAVVVMSILAAATSVTILYLRPALDALDVLGRVMSLFAPTTLGLMAYMKSQETKLLVNGRLDSMMEQAKQAAFHQGRASMREETGSIVDKIEATVSTVQAAAQKSIEEKKL